MTAADDTPGRLRIAMLGPISWRVPPRHYGPWEQFTSLLTEGLVAAGMDVTLFATADSLTSARLVGTAPTGYSENTTLDVKVWECLHISALFERASEFDVLHNSFDFLPLSYAALVATPMVTTIHGFSSERIVPVYRKYNHCSSYVAISNSNRHRALDYAATIHHGIDMDAFAARAEPRHYLLFFGRIHPDKGTARAIEVARRAGLPLTIAGIVQDRAYFEQYVKPHVDGHRVRFIGAIGPDERAAVLGGARALLHLIEFDEPFGFSVVEAMASGTPVIAHERGSMTELVEPGKNGFLVRSIDDAVEAVRLARGLNPTHVRATVEHEFSVERMVSKYIAVYRRVVARRAAQASSA